MLVRKYIHQRLNEYYAQPFDHVVGSILSSSSSNWMNNGMKKNPQYKKRIPFRFLLGEYHWNYIYGNLYRKTKGQWLTPSELFSPFYGQCIALWIVRQATDIMERRTRRQEQQRKRRSKATGMNADMYTPSSYQVEIVELGGGRGTNAIDVLNFLREQHNETIYKLITSYTIVDSSIPLLQYQKEEVFSNSSNINDHGSKLKNKQLDLYDYANQSVKGQDRNLFESATTLSPNKDDIISIVIGLEILDNLPHDKIRVQKRQRGNNDLSVKNDIVEQAELVEENHMASTTTSTVTINHDDSSNGNKQMYKEIYVPLSDKLLQLVLQNYPVSATPFRFQYYWIPSIACGTIRKIFQERPNACILLADFDCFLNTSTMIRSQLNQGNHFPSPAINEPIVTDMNDTDLASYLQVPKTPTDILFPTNFNALASFIERIYPTRQMPEQSLNDHRSKSPIGATSVTDRHVQVRKQYDFLQEYGPEQIRATTSYVTGYSPMVHDFENCSILTVKAHS